MPRNGAAVRPVSELRLMMCPRSHDGFDTRVYRVIGAYIQTQHLDTGETVGA
jgi:hypothetical protein